MYVPQLSFNPGTMHERPHWTLTDKPGPQFTLAVHFEWDYEEELQRRTRIAEEHGDKYSTPCVVGTPRMFTRIRELTQRFLAMQFIVECHRP